MKGEVISVVKVWDEASCCFFWQITIEFIDLPNLKMGNCEVKQ